MDPSELLARRFQALAVATRVRILALLEDGCLCVNALAARLGVTQAAASQHLRILKDAGFVEAERCGSFMHYRLSNEALGEWRGVLDRVFLESGEMDLGKGEIECAAKKKSAKRKKN